MAWLEWVGLFFDALWLLIIIYVLGSLGFLACSVNRGCTLRKCGANASCRSAGSPAGEPGRARLSPVFLMLALGLAQHAAAAR